ncbi:acyl-CoA dehydrogenase domain-containing protein [Sphingobium chlorophenolicum L-1]|uniref:Acyl-CoA dehydrogenase domain-containing protein n=1 Tax=Sphingobium chlorophenolicum L-1 TaxID=690566 RepID=F6ETZ2_SPHCR|nr:acyl-CoA dehydrogenase [Sphingobium chlorophenolicum]AEG47799.1 acyl-CoA dehydrogenase domain-containing protein [Sphingobium chlorophenolicum L-1]
MDFSYGEDRRMLADTLGRYLQQRYPIETRHRISGSETGWSPEQWAALAELGVVGALFAEDAGGFGGDGFDIAALFEQLGNALVVEPFLGALMAGRALAAAGGQEELIGEIISGSTILAFAHEEPQSHYDLTEVATRAERSGDGWTLTGAKSVVPQAEAADRILVSARIGGASGEQGIGLFLVDAKSSGLSIRGYPLIDGGRGGELTLANATATLVAEDGFALVEDAVAAGIVALCWEAVGIMDALKRDTLDYLRTRKQFGVPIGKFQALQHRMATVALEIEQARSAAINAADALGGDRNRRERAVSAAKYTIGRTGTIVAEEAIQMHGGIGMTWELPLSHHAKRLTMIGHQLGDEDHHLARFTALDLAA